MRYIFRDNLYDSPYEEDIFELLCLCDEDFFPSLSSREDSKQMNLEGLSSDSAKPYRYFDKIKSQAFIFTINEEDRCIALMSFIPDYESEELKEIAATNYISTICVHPEFRKRGILKDLYRYMFEKLPKTYKLPTISTRTWSLNKYHLIALEKLGFKVHRVIKDHRGKGIDTLYFVKTMV